MSRTVPVSFRFPVGLKEQLELAAAENNRSTTAEIVHRLEVSLNNNDESTHDKLDEIIVRLKALNAQ